MSHGRAPARSVRHRVGKPDPLNPSFGIGPAGELRPERHPQLVSGERQRYGANQRVMPIEEKHRARADADPAAGARHGMIEPHVEIAGIGLRPDRGSERSDRAEAAFGPAEIGVNESAVIGGIGNAVEVDRRRK